MYLLGNQIAEKNVMVYVLKGKQQGCETVRMENWTSWISNIVPWISWPLPDKFYVRYSKKTKHLLLLNNACP